MRTSLLCKLNGGSARPRAGFDTPMSGSPLSPADRGLAWRVAVRLLLLIPASRCTTMGAPLSRQDGAVYRLLRYHFRVTPPRRSMKYIAPLRDDGSCMATLRIIRITSKPGTMPHLNLCRRGQRHGIASFEFISIKSWAARGSGAPRNCTPRRYQRHVQHRHGALWRQGSSGRSARGAVV